MNDTLQIQLTIIDGKATVTSLEVAQSFGKEHAKVLRDIRSIRDQDTEANFGLSEYTDESGKTNPCYILDRDGFTLLAMGFTGKKAMEFKKLYIRAFNEMEARLVPKQMTLRESLNLNLDLLDKTERLEKENKQQQRVIEDQNILHGSLIKLKATETRTALKALKDDLGSEVNKCVFKLFSNVASPRQRHLAAHALYKRMTGKTYLGANNSSYESKCDYLDFLKTQINRLETENN